MALKFLYITQDPFTNNSEEFVRILAIYSVAQAPGGLQGATNPKDTLHENDDT